MGEATPVYLDYMPLWPKDKWKCCTS
jgi:hypothetical protein